MKVLTAVRSMLRGLVRLVVGERPVVRLQGLDLGRGRRRPVRALASASAFSFGEAVDQGVRAAREAGASACAAVEPGRGLERTLDRLWPRRRPTSSTTPCGVAPASPEVGAAASRGCCRPWAGCPRGGRCTSRSGPVKNITSVARKSHIATLPGVTGGCWTAGRRGRRDVVGQRGLGRHRRRVPWLGSTSLPSNRVESRHADRSARVRPAAGSGARASGSRANTGTMPAAAGGPTGRSRRAQNRTA